LNPVKLKKAMVRLQNKLIQVVTWKIQGRERVENVQNFR